MVTDTLKAQYLSMLWLTGYVMPVVHGTASSRQSSAARFILPFSKVNGWPGVVMSSSSTLKRVCTHSRLTHPRLTSITSAHPLGVSRSTGHCTQSPMLSSRTGITPLLRSHTSMSSRRHAPPMPPPEPPPVPLVVVAAAMGVEDSG